MYGGFADFENAVAREAERCDPWVPSQAEPDRESPKVNDLLEVYDGPRVEESMTRTPQFGSSEGSEGSAAARIRVDRHVLDSLGPGRVVEWESNGQYPRWPRFCTLATCPAGVLPALVEDMPKPVHYDAFPEWLRRREHPQ